MIPSSELRGLTQLERDVYLTLVAHGFVPFQSEYLFAGHLGRKWRFDFAWPENKVALEVEGGTFSGGRHTTGTGFHADCEKYTIAAIEGWIVVRVTSKHIDEGQHLKWVAMALAERSREGGSDADV